MLNSILEIRKWDDEQHRILLQIAEKDYFSVYDSLNDSNAEEILENYLKYRADDGRPEEVKISHDKNKHIVEVDAVVNYLGNEKTKDM